MIIRRLWAGILYSLACNVLHQVTVVEIAHLRAELLGSDRAS